MRVETLYIVGICAKSDPDGEATDTIACVNALMGKYRVRCKNAKSFHVTYDDLVYNMMNSSSAAKDGKVAPAASSSRYGQAEGTDLAEFDEKTQVGKVGMYIVGNFYLRSQALEGFTGEGVARIVKPLVETPQLDYVCLVACNAGKKRAHFKNDRKFLADFCTTLQAEEPRLTPIVAAYTSYVDIAYPGADRHGVEHVDTHAGDKVVDFADRDYGYMKAGHAETKKEDLKILFQYSKGGLQVLEGRTSWVG